jgi:WD40 repeat protein
MAYKRNLLTVAAIILFAFGFPFSSTALQSNSDGGVRVITLSASGFDIANSVAYSPDGKWLAVGTSSGISIFDSQTLTQKRFITTGVWVRSLIFSPDGATIAAGLFDGTARFWGLSTGQEIRTFTGHDGWVRSVAFSLDGELFATAADDDTVRLWNAADGSIKLTIPGLPGVRVLALSPDGRTLAVGLQDASIQLLDISDGSLIKTLQGHKGWVRSLAFSPDGKTLVSGAFDATAIIWDVDSGQLKYTLTDHQSSVLGLSFSPDGKTFASSSVDSTVKLWNVEDGSLVRTLVGHTDFVYSVAFSPDGKTIASGSSDNSVRVWDLADPSAGVLPQPATPGDCRVCHHPHGTSAQPRVIQVKCEACHSKGIGVNFCPFFARAAEATSLPLTFAESNLPVGVPVSNSELAVILNYPTNGETVYTASANFAPLFVVGRVKSTSEAENVLVQLFVFSADSDKPELMLETHPSADGQFNFNLRVNPQGAQPAPLQPGGPDCRVCHEEFQSQGNLPNGVVHLVVRAISPNDGTATDERWFEVDTSTTAQVDVRVIEKDSQEVVNGLPVRASTILYEWRARHFRQETDAQGMANLKLEALMQGPTTYQITVPDTVLNGYYYSVVEPATITLEPNDSAHETITLEVRLKTSHISGSLSGITFSEPLDVFAIHLPDGLLYKTKGANGTFEFRDLPSGEYLLIIDPQFAARLGIQAQPVSVDLSKLPEANVKLQLDPLSETRLSGQLQEKSALLLPFGWITTASGQTVLSDPVTGTFTFTQTDSTKPTITVVVPGYYSQIQVLDIANEAPITLTLIRQPETVSMPWGAGEIILPSDSVYTNDAEGIRLTRGWVWGQGDGSPVTLSVAGMQIKLTSGTFAVQYLPPAGGWLYLSKGTALIQTADGFEVPVQGGEMVALSEGAAIQPVPYNEAVVAILNPASESPVSAIWEPSLSAQFQNRLAQIGISAAQLITFVTYLIVLAVLVAIIARGIYWLWTEFKKS